VTGLIKKPAIANNAAKKTPHRGRDDFSFSPPKSKLTVIIYIVYNYTISILFMLVFLRKKLKNSKQ